MRLCTLAALCGVAGIAHFAHAQAEHPVITWDVSTDNGLTWSSNVSLTNGSPASVKVRGSLGWNAISSIDTAFCVVALDGIITGAGTETGSNVSTPLQHTVLGPSLGSVVNLGGGVVRFSSITDSGAPGSNTNWWVIAQDPDVILDGGGHSFPDIDLSNPAHFLYFDLAIDYSTTHSLDISCIMDPGNDRAARVFYRATSGGMTSQSRFDRAQIAIEHATIQITVPTPSALCVLGLGGIAITRRRR